MVLRGCGFMRFSAVLAAVAVLSFATSASADVVYQVLFHDGFENETPNAPAQSLDNFNIFGTSVDVVAPDNPYGITVSSNVVDLDGTPGPGFIRSKQKFAFLAGDVLQLQFVVGGSQRDSAFDDFRVTVFTSGIGTFTGTGRFFPYPSVFAPAVTRSTSIPGDAPFGTSSLIFTAASSGVMSFQFGSLSTDGIGPLLDEVTLISMSAVPEPTTWMTLTLGFGLIGSILRRLRASLRAFASPGVRQRRVPAAAR